MSGNQFRIAILAALAVLTVSAVAQDEKNELAAMVGRTFVSDVGIQCGGCINPLIENGKGLTLEGDYSRFFRRSQLYAISGEVLFAFNFDQDLNSGENVVPSGYKSLFVTPAARVNIFPDTAFSPWVSLGGGIGRFMQDKSLVYGGTNPGKNTLSGVLEAGVGLDVRIWRHYSLRGEARDFWSGFPSYPLATTTTSKSRQHNYFVGAGIVWHF